jgi:uncharacterized protein
VNLRRFEDIIAVQTKDGIIAYHARNLEVAELSPEAYKQMSEIDLKSGAIPLQNLSNDEATVSLRSWQNEENLDVKSGRLEFGIKSLTINVTQICNLKCTYCAAGGDGTYGDPVNRINVEKTLPQLKFFLEKLKDGSNFNLSFVGGEPLLYPEAIKVIYDYILLQTAGRNINCKFMITTNGTLISDSVLELLKTMRINITVSLDGEKSVNDVVRPSKDGRSSTDLTLEGIKKLVSIKSGLSSIGVTGVYSAKNLEVTKSYLFFKSLGVDWYEFNFSYIEKNEAAQTEFLRQMAEIADLAWQAGGEAEIRKIKTFNLYFETLDSQQRIENFCGAGKSFLMIDAKNQVYTCPWVVGEKDEIVGTGASLDMQKLDKYQKPLIELNNCQTCWARFLCGGGCMYIHREHTGDKHKKDILFCERTRGLILLGIMYYKRARAE